MSDTEKMLRALVLVRAPKEAGGEAILLVVRQDAFVELADGPWPGVMIEPAEARVLAYRLLLFAAEIEAGVPPQA